MLIIAAFNACTNNKADEKALMDKVISMHDTVMGKSEKIMKNSLALDSFIKTKADTTKIHTATILKSKLKMADEAMMTWMHQFNPDFTGKPHTEVMVYLTTQQKQLHRIDSLLNLAINKSDKFFK